jgi:dolichol kinase
MGLAILWIALNFSDYARWLLFLLLVSGIILSLLSLRFELPFIYFMLKKFEKPRYIRRFPGKGTLFFIAGCLLVLKLFPYGIALASIAILTFADPVATLSGLLIGKKNHRKPFNTLKKIEGTILGIAAGFLAALFFVSYIKALIAASVAMLAEALTLQLGGDDVDDNLLVPLVAATTLYLIGKFFPLL